MCSVKLRCDEYFTNLWTLLHPELADDHQGPHDDDAEVRFAGTWWTLGQVDGMSKSLKEALKLL
jgi:hypothetical protein